MVMAMFSMLSSNFLVKFKQAVKTIVITHKRLVTIASLNLQVKHRMSKTKVIAHLVLLIHLSIYIL